MNKFAILKDNQIVQQIVMVGEKLNYKTPTIMDLVFYSEKSAKEVSEVLKGEVVVYDQSELKAAA